MIRFESYRGSKLRSFMAEICPNDLFHMASPRLSRDVARWFQRGLKGFQTGFRGVSQSETIGVFLECPKCLYDSF